MCGLVQIFLVEGAGLATAVAALLLTLGVRKTICANPIMKLSQVEFYQTVLFKAAFSISVIYKYMLESRSPKRNNFT